MNRFFVTFDYLASKEPVKLANKIHRYYMSYFIVFSTSNLNISLIQQHQRKIVCIYSFKLTLIKIILNNYFFKKNQCNVASKLHTTQLLSKYLELEINFDICVFFIVFMLISYIF